MTQQQDEAARMVAFEGVVKLAKWTDSSSAGPKVTFTLLDKDALTPFEKATKRRGKKSGQRYLVTLADSRGELITAGAPDECILLGAQWTHTAGATATFAFGDLLFWRGLNTADQSDTPTELHLVLVELQADETPVDQVSQAAMEKATKPKGGPRSKHVAQVVQASDFCQFVGKRLEMPQDRWHMVTADMADKWVKQVCGIESKVDFDYNQQAWERYENLVKRPFITWARSYFGESYGRY
jgi:hypothetical protein